MASSIGPRARGSDGTDFAHRERVADHYRQSAEFKPKLKRMMQLQILSALMCISVGLVTRYDYCCLLCFTGYVCGLPCGFLALKKNSPTYINLYGCCCSLLGVFPMVYLLYVSLWTGMVDRYRYVRLGVAVMVILANTTGMFYAKKLMTAWGVRTNNTRRR